MLMDIINKTLGPLNECIESKAELLPFSESGDFLPIKIKFENFHQLGLFPPNKHLVAIDGGNAEILNGPSFSLHLIRVVSVTYKDKVKIKTMRKEFFCLIQAIIIDGFLKYKVDIIGETLALPKKMDSEIITIDGQKFSIEPTTIAEYMRRYSELIMADEALDASKPDSLVVIDGSIKSKTPFELNLIKNLIKKSEDSNVLFGFLSKTCNLLTKNAKSLTAALQEVGPKSAWYYHPIFRIKNPEYRSDTYFVKLHQNTEYVFKLELTKTNKQKECIEILSTNAKDPIFLGYPYALILADRLARVSNREKKYLKTIFLGKVKSMTKLRHIISSSSAHEILDKISY